MLTVCDNTNYVSSVLFGYFGPLPLLIESAPRKGTRYAPKFRYVFTVERGEQTTMITTKVELTAYYRRQVHSYDTKKYRIHTYRISTVPHIFRGSFSMS